MAKRGLGINVLDAAMLRMKKIFDDFPKIYVSFSGGKDSSVMLHIALNEAQRRNRKIGVLIVDLEAQYKLTIDHVSEMVTEYAEWIDLYWVALPIALRNAVSQYEPKWKCWDSEKRNDWVRLPDSRSIVDPDFFPFFTDGMEFEEFVPKFGEWYADGKLCACLVGIRSDESLNRYRTIAGRKTTYENLQWTTKVSNGLYNAYPIYDWRTSDIWVFNAKFKAKYNKLYDLMNQAGLTISQQRICQPYGDDQRRGLWLYHVIEPETWGKVVKRVSGVNSGSLYIQERGNINGYGKVTKPDGRTWKEYANFLLESMPEASSEHFKNKIAVFIKWYEDRGYPKGIPDDGDPNDKTKPSWTRIVKVLLRNDYWCKGLSFTMHKNEAYEKYKKLMKKRREEWKII